MQRSKGEDDHVQTRMTVAGVEGLADARRAFGGISNPQIKRLSMIASCACVPRWKLDTADVFFSSRVVRKRVLASPKH